MKKRTNVWAGSHLPVLAKLLSVIDKPVIELGIGYNSTPLLHWMCKERGVQLMSFETDKEWMDKFKEFQEEDHYMEHVKDWNFLDQLASIDDFGLVFIDHKPARKRRSSALKFKDTADFVVLHDSELADHPAYKYRSIYKEFKYSFEFKEVGEPHTIVLSNKKELSWLKNSANQNQVLTS